MAIDTNTGSEYQLIIKDKKHLKISYMPFVKNSGLFITTKNEHNLNDNVIIILQLLDEPEEYVIHGKVVWLNPKFTQGGHPQGIGVQFNDKDKNGRIVRDKIENQLAGFRGDNDSPATM